MQISFVEIFYYIDILWWVQLVCVFYKTYVDMIYEIWILKYANHKVVILAYYQSILNYTYTYTYLYKFIQNFNFPMFYD